MAAGKRVPWRQDRSILERLLTVEERVLAGEHNTAIAAALGVTESTIRWDRQRLQELWREQVGGEVRARRLVRIAELEALRDEALTVARRHERFGQAVLVGEPIDGKPLARDDRGKVEFRGQTAQLLQTARQAIMDAAKVEGLVVEKVSPTDADGRTLDLAALMQLARTEDAGADADR